MGNRIDRDFFISSSELLESKAVPGYDFHIHTVYADGKATVRQVFETAVRENLEVIIFTEHTEQWHHSEPSWFDNYYNDIVTQRNLFKNIKAFIGIEAPAITFEGELELTEDMALRAEFVIGAAHRYPMMGNRKVRELSKTEAIDLEFRTLFGLAGNTQIDAIAHIGATCTKYCTTFPKSLAREIIKRAVENNIAIEINPVYHAPLLEFIELCASENALITFGSNAHGFNDIGLTVKKVRDIFK